MKKLFNILLTCFLISMCLFVLSACVIWADGGRFPQSHTHVFNNAIIGDEYKKSDATCKNLATYYYSCACGVKGTNTFTDGVLKPHEYNTLKSNENYHWYECVCGNNNGYTSHSGGNATCQSKAVCYLCNNEYGEVLEHEFVNNEACSLCGEQYSSPGLQFTFVDYGTEDKVYEVAVGSCTDENIIIPSVYKDIPVTKIRVNGFYDCDWIVSVKIPDSVTIIGDAAFSYCDNLTTVTIPNSVTYMGIDVFFDDDSINFNEKDGLKYLGNDQNKYFYLDSPVSKDIITANIDANCKIIGSNAFNFYNRLVSVNVPDGVTYLENYLFENCSALQEINFGKNSQLERIGYGVFQSCYSLKSIVIPDSVVNIDGYAFCYCYDLESVIFGENSKLESIGSWAFAFCWELKSIDIPEEVTSIGENPFIYSNKLESINVDSKNTAFMSIDGNLYSKDGTVLLQYAVAKAETTFTIPNRVRIIGNYAISQCYNLTTIKLESNSELESIGYYAFYDSNNITSIELSSKLTTIGLCAFYSCYSLTSLTIPVSVTSIEDNAFVNCNNLLSITVDNQNNTYKSIAGNLYSKDGKTLFCYAPGKGATSFAIPNGVTNIERYAFYNCNNLKSVTIPNGVISIGDSAFAGCNYLESVNIPNSVTTIGESAFNSCSRLESITFGKNSSLKEIEYYAFSYCSALKEIEIPASVTSIGLNVFNGCYNITNINVDSENTVYKSIDGNLYSKDGKTLFYYAVGKTEKSFVIPNGVNSIGIRAFENAKNLESIVIPDSVISIEYYAFEFCTELKTIIIPASVTSIAHDVFWGCENLTDIYCEAESQPSGWNSSWSEQCSADVHWGYKGE